MKSLNTYINEGLAEWGDDKAINKKLSKQTTKTAVKNEIIDWIVNNTNGRIYKNKLKFNFDTTHITVDYDGDIELNWKADSLTNGLFQWGKVRGYFDCNYCDLLKSLEGAPKEVGGRFVCKNCVSIKTLEGAPEKVGSTFSCEKCKSLISLEGAPKEVGGDFNCENCTSLTTLEGAPKEVGGYFNCKNCTSLRNLKGAPKKVGREFDCSRCGIQFTENDVKKVSKVKGKINC